MDARPDPHKDEVSLAARLKTPALWLLLLLLSAALAFIFEAAGLPAALLLGPMLAAAIFAMHGIGLTLYNPPYLAAQALIGTMAAGAVSGGIVGSFLGHWPFFLPIVFTVIAASTLSGFVLTRLRVLPGTTAIWGSSAGAATSMLVMADAYGADIRLVAFMQYLRVVCVAGAAAVVARLWVEGDIATPATEWFAAVELWPFVLTLAMTAAGAALGWVLKVPAGLFMGAFILTAVLGGSGLVHVVLPQSLLALCYGLLGWKIGLGFTRNIVAHARRAILPIIGSIAFLMAVSALLAVLLTVFAGIDPLTAYLATSPGGLDSIAIIAAHSDVDLPFVMALQTARLLIIMAIGPVLARFVANRS